MIAEAGHFALVLALGLALIQSVVPILGARWGDPALMNVARSAALAQLLFVAASFAALTKWAEGGKPPPSAPKLNITQVNKPPQQSPVAKNADGLAQGGIQLAALAAPTQINLGVNAPSATIPTGTLIKNTQRQLYVSVIQPPKVGPTMGAISTAKPNSVMATPCLSRGKASSNIP